MKSIFNRGFGRHMRISAIAAGLLSLWMIVHILAVVPQLHHELHEDESSPDHQCLLTELASGLIDPAPPDQTPQPLCELLCVQLAPASEEPAYDIFSPPLAARPPPCVFQSFSQAGS